MNVDRLAGKYEQLLDKTRNHSFITVKDNNSAEIECCKRVIKFEDNIIELVIPCGIIKIIGLELKLKTFGFDSVKISGRLHSIEFDETTKGSEEEK